MKKSTKDAVIGMALAAYLAIGVTIMLIAMLYIA